MKLRSLHLHGFKSFAERTTIEFREGLTAIVGSNGCGKSNIADAVRWVLGEQRAGALRSAKMDEVIFQGTARRRPLNFAEVTLLFGNEQGRVQVPQTEIEVTRRVFREGGSEYSLNRNPCRLRDIQALLRDTGLGANAYSIIEAPMIEVLLSDRAEERRLLFEEAAGIGRYKDSRQAATRRLQLAEGDLERLDDLVTEVEAKVRTLGRQRRKAQRHRELHALRLSLEVAIARRELEQTSTAMAAGEQRHAALVHDRQAARLQQTTSETEIETHRLEAAELSTRRAGAAVRLDEVRQRLNARERELLLADERRGHAALRLEQLVRDQAAARQRLDTLRHATEQLGAEWGGAREHLAGLRQRADAATEREAAVRALLAAARTAADAAMIRSRDAELSRATAEADRAAAHRRHTENEERLARLEARQQAVAGELNKVGEQTDLWSTRTDHLRERAAAAAAAAAATRQQAAERRTRERSARDALRRADDDLSQWAARVAAHEAVEREYEGFAPAVAALMAARSTIRGVLHPLADYVAPPTDGALPPAAVEFHLGPLLQAVVVEKLQTARAVRRWFREQWHGGGSLLLLPLDAPSLREAPPSPFGAGAGAPWLDLLMRDVAAAGADDPLRAFAPGAAFVAERESLDARGIVHLQASEANEQGILERREALARLRTRRDDAAAERDLLRGERTAAQQALAEAEDLFSRTDRQRETADAEMRQVKAEADAHLHLRNRLLRDYDEVVHRVAGLRASLAEAQQHGAAAERRLAELASATDAAHATAAELREQLAELDARWEALRDRGAEVRVSLVRAEAESASARRRLDEVERDSHTAAQQERTAEAEAAELRTTIGALATIRDRAATDTEALFLARDRETAELSVLEARMREVHCEIAALEARLRDARRGESAAAEQRHHLELQIAELRSRGERIRERLEAEWGRPWEQLDAEAAPPPSADFESWHAELREAREQTAAVGPVNMLAEAEFEEEDRRLSFLREQQTDLVLARDDLAAAIRQINRTARDVFQHTFAAVQANFQRTFQSLFQGGECDLRLANPDDPLESPVEIQASPRGKRTQRIHLLSGGERTLTALALLFALYLVKPSPFCLLDEVDAPLDEANVGRFIQLLNQFKADTQFVVITHNPRTMEAADWLYGVTMEEPGISSIVGVEMLIASGAEPRARPV